jgi:hypothetical protein
VYGNKITFTLEPGEYKWIDSKIDSMQQSLANGKKGFNLQVEAEAVDAVAAE